MAQEIASKNSLKIARKSLPETLAESIRERILSGEFREGEALIQESLADEYAVSRMPVREALRQLEASGLVEMKNHKGAVVTSVPLDQIAELFDLRATLECNLLLHAVPLMTSASVTNARSILLDLESAYERKDVATWGTLNWELHKALYEPAGHVQTLAIVQGINVQTDRYIRLQLLLSEDFSHADEEHFHIIEACAAGKVDDAVNLLRSHILGTKSSLLQAIKEYRANPSILQ